MKTHIFKTQLLQAKKVVRDIEVTESTNLFRLAEVIVDAYGFDFDHAFGFFRTVTDRWDFRNVEKYELFADMEDQGIEPVDAGSVNNTKVSDIWKQKGDKMLFLFDYGDDWRWVVTLKEFGERNPKQKYPRVVKKVGTVPEQYPEVEE